MNQHDIELVRDNWAIIENDPQTIARRFYQRLFELDRSAADLFPDDMEDQRNKFVTALRLAVQNLDRPDELRPIIVGMGERHANYGVHKEQFDTVGQALLDALDDCLGDHFTHLHRGAWARAYGFLAEPMKDQVPAQPRRGLLARLFAH